MSSTITALICFRSCAGVVAFACVIEIWLLKICLSTITTPRPTPFLATTPCARVLISFVIISDSDDKITTLPVRPAPPSSDCIPVVSGYPLDYGDDSSDEDLSETAESPYTLTASTSVVHLPPTRPLPTSLAFARRPGKKILIPPPSLLPSLSSPPPSLLPSSSRKRSISPPPPLLPVVSPSPLSLPPLPLPSPALIPPPLEHLESVRDDVETMRVSLVSAMQETMTLRARVGLLEQHDVIDRLETVELHSRAEYIESYLEQSHERQTRDGAHTTDITYQDIKTLRARAEAAEKRVETLQVLLGAAQMDVKYLIESREADKLEMPKLRSRA
ncbi:hypothetical protein Tco_0934893 [Tanacetum coccineum]